MVEKLLSFFKSNNIATKSNFLVAISGGVDSAVLSHLLKEATIDFALAHCNFNLRGTESDKDQRFVENLANEFGVKIHTISFETEKIAKSKKESIQMVARDLRYHWFEELREAFLYDYVLTAHHKGDVAETILFNLTKGTGIEGLHGIKPVIGHLVRPLLFATRTQITEYATSRELAWREDSSNKLVKYSRNKIRHLVLPVLEEINPKAQESIYNASQRVSEAELFLKHTLKQVLALLIKKSKQDILIDLKILTDTPGYTYVLHEILKPMGFNYSQTQSIVSSIHGLSGKLFYSASHLVNLDRSNLIISPLNQEEVIYILNESQNNLKTSDLEIVCKTIDNEHYTIKSTHKIVGLDKDKLKFPLELRHWKQGDVFYPLGMKGKKKLSDFMIDAKIPVNLKSKLWVLVSQNEIVALLNYRISDCFKITEATKRVYELTLKETSIK
ncbi:MAG: tRNA lysidine(34) synthetase TilS [Cyclobacteriaceae bacterium]|nr:tRNA lysidine(34) synthetase TilS [Cyclobacteriaceae bacterium]